MYLSICLINFLLGLIGRIDGSSSLVGDPPEALPWAYAVNEDIYELL